MLRWYAGHTIPISAIPIPGAEVLRLHPPRADRRRRPDHPLELPAADGGLEARRRRWPPAARSSSSPPSRRRSRALRLGELIAEAGIPDGVSTSSPASARRPARRWPHIRASTRSPSPARPRSASRSSRPRPATSRRCRWSSAASRPTSSSRTPTSTPPSPAPPTRSSSTTASAARGSRLYVQRQVFDEVVAGRRRAAEGIKLGDGFDPETQMGPLVSDEQLRRVTGYMASGREQGARSLVGGSRFGDRGYFFQPTVLVDAKQDMQIVREEIFGPVVTRAAVRRPQRACRRRERHAATVWRPASGRRTSPRRTPSPPSWGRHGLDQHAITSSTPPCRSAATRSRAGAARWATTRWSCTPR